MYFLQPLKITLFMTVPAKYRIRQHWACQGVDECLLCREPPPPPQIQPAPCLAVLTWGVIWNIFHLNMIRCGLHNDRCIVYTITHMPMCTWTHTDTVPYHLSPVHVISHPVSAAHARDCRSNSLEFCLFFFPSWQLLIAQRPRSGLSVTTHFKLPMQPQPLTPALLHNQPPPSVDL